VSLLSRLVTTLLPYIVVLPDYKIHTYTSSSFTFQQGHQPSSIQVLADPCWEACLLRFLKRPASVGEEDVEERRGMRMDGWVGRWGRGAWHSRLSLSLSFCSYLSVPGNHARSPAHKRGGFHFIVSTRRKPGTVLLCPLSGVGVYTPLWGEEL